MRRIGLEVLAVAVFGLCAGGARAADPCSPAQSFGGPLASLIGQFTQQQRAQACVTERQAQWAEYNGRQKAAADKAAADKIAADKVVADAALQKQAADAKIVGRVAAPARRGRAVRDTVVAEVRVRHRREASRVDAPDPQVAEAHRHEMYLRLVRDENAPDNLCHDPKTARTVMTGWNGLDTMKGASVQVIDIEHMTTVYVHADDKSVSCHGVFVTNHGGRLVGTATMRHNIAGDAMFVWERDADQDLTRFSAPAGVEVKVVKAVSVSTDGVPPI